MNLQIEKATKEQAEEILNLQKAAYQSEAEIYQDYNIPPLRQTLSSIREDFENYTFLIAVQEDKIIGSVKLSLKDFACFIERLIVAPESQNRGIGSALLKAAYDEFPNAKRFELFTGSKSEKNIGLYQKHGFNVFRKEKLSEKVDLVFMEKTIL